MRTPSLRPAATSSSHRLSAWSSWGSATQEWANAASNAPVETVISHPQFGALGAVEIIRRNAHEVRHHLMDINRYRAR